MLQAMNTGHDGSLSTGHANSSRDMVSRLETMVLMGMELPLPAIRSQIASGIDILVHLGRLRDKSRKVLSITEIMGVSDGEVLMQELFHFVEEGSKNGKICGKLIQVTELQHVDKCQMAGYRIGEMQRPAGHSDPEQEVVGTEGVGDGLYTI